MLVIGQNPKREDVPPGLIIGRLCGPIIEVVGDDAHVQFVHFTVKTY